MVLNYLGTQVLVYRIFSWYFELIELIKTRHPNINRTYLVHFGWFLELVVNVRQKL